MNNQPFNHYKFGLTDYQMECLRPVLDEMDRNARAFGWEIGRLYERGDLIGIPKTLDMSPDNPFIDQDWRIQVTYGDAGETPQNTETPSIRGDQQPEQRQDPLRWGGSGEVPHSSRLLPYEGGTG